MYVCLDIGGSSIKTAIMNREGEFTRTQSLPIAEDFAGFISELARYLDEMVTKYSISGIAISAPGAVDVETGIVGGSSAIPYIHGPNFKEILSTKYGVPVSIDNDANCAALGEVYFGENKTIRDLAFVVCGTGIGGAIIKDRKVHRGTNLHGGEFGYMIMQYDQDIATWSKIGSTKILVDKVQAHYNDTSIDGKVVFERAKKGDQICLNVIDEFYTIMAVGIMNIQYMYDPEYVLVSGAISDQADFITQINDKLTTMMEHNHDRKIFPQVMKCTYEKDANLYGALAHHLMEYHNLG
ncbi:MAG: ROK family protein [Culicoidibacterales bacterium]